jgi:16S rRNA (guanine527-N7)-methyltransferase
LRSTWSRYDAGVNELWNDLARRAGIELSSEQHEQLNGYLDLLFAANERMNLTRITDRAGAELNHIADALTLLPHLPRTPESEVPRRPGSLRIVDLGSGGGVPAIPLKIVLPHAFVMMIESTRKKATFLEETILALKLTEIAVSPDRAESVGVDEMLRASFDVAISRAVATMPWLAEWSLPLVKKGGKMLAMKGKKVAEELPIGPNALNLLGGGPPIIHPVDLAGTEHHVIVEIPKIGRTDKRYPRPATQAKGNPLR